MDLNNKTAQMANFIALTTEFFNPPNTKIIEAIEAGLPIRISNQSKFSDVRLDNYLGEFETIAKAYDEGLLSEDQFCTSFSHCVEITDNYKEITDYVVAVMKKQKKDDLPFFVGLSSLAKVNKLKCRK